MRLRPLLAEDPCGGGEALLLTPETFLFVPKDQAGCGGVPRWPPHLTTPPRVVPVNRLIRIAWCAWLGLLLPLSAPAGEAMLKLLKVLRDRGSLTEAEYRMLVEAAEADAAAVGGKPVGVMPTSQPQPQPQPSAATASPSADRPVPAGGAASAAAPAGDPKQAAPKPGEPASPISEAVHSVLKGRWYEKIGLRGYAQVRYTQVLDHDGPELNVPNDASASESATFLLRRGRVVLSGDVTERLYVYAQADFNASLSSGEFGVGMRDYYGDIALDNDKEFRVRVGQSKVPFGWVNMQSSQNRAPMERPDGLNSAVEGERDIGVFGYWASSEARERFRDLVKLGLKGSGDYGVAGLGAYSGQGLNRLDLNGEPHVVARLDYPWKLANGQFVETGIQAYHGRFVSGVTPVNLGSGTFLPSRDPDGVTDERVAATFVWYPQPFGVEAEWNVGRGPTLDEGSRRVDSQFLHGGYVQLAYRLERFHGEWYPFARWHYFEGGRKFAANAPHSRVNEVDLGFEWRPWKEVEMTVAYTRTVERTNTRLAPYEQTENADRVGFQVQINY